MKRAEAQHTRKTYNTFTRAVWDKLRVNGMKALDTAQCKSLCEAFEAKSRGNQKKHYVAALQSKFGTFPALPQ